MTFLLYRLFSVEYFEREHEDDPGELLERVESRLIGEFSDLDLLKRRMETEAAMVAEKQPTPPSTVPLNRFAAYEPTGDVDKDGFPDGFKFMDVFTGSTPEPETPTIRKAKRKT